MSTLLLLAVAAVAGVAAVRAFAALERRDQPEVAVAIVLAAVVAQGLLYPLGDVAGGIFRPGGRFRLPELLLAAALIARLQVRGLPTRWTPAGLAWIFFFAWYAASAVVGRMLGNPAEEVFFQAKAIVYVGGAAALASGVPPARLATRSALGGWLVGLAGVVLFLISTSLSKTWWPLALPGLPAAQLGRLGPDVASALAALGVVVLVVEASRRNRRPLVLLAATALLSAPVGALQRAAFVADIAALALVAAVVPGTAWRRRIPGGVTIVGFGMLGLLFLGVGLSLVRIGEGAAVPGAREYRLTFLSVGKQQSTDARRLKWDVGRAMLRERPAFGWGLGTQFTSFRPGKEGTEPYRTTGVFDSVPFDLLVRSGIVGLALFVAAMALSIRDGWRVWREHVDHQVAALGLACVVVVLGLVAKGLAESILDKAILATLLGLLLGVIAAATREMNERTVPAWSQVAPQQGGTAWN